MQDQTEIKEDRGRPNLDRTEDAAEEAEYLAAEGGASALARFAESTKVPELAHDFVLLRLGSREGQQTRIECEVYLE